MQGENHPGDHLAPQEDDGTWSAPERTRLPFDPIEEAARQWGNHCGRDAPDAGRSRR
jgi:hypothetical protein